MNVPLEVVPLTDTYWERVVKFTISEYEKGRTPNPDIMCNSRVKFGAFYDHVGCEKESLLNDECNNTTCAGNDDSGLTSQFDIVASGHYARSIRLHRDEHRDDGLFSLCCSPDLVKDQTYFLSSLKQSQLRHARFPIGSITKPQVRQIAAELDLSTSTRRDSRGICFLVDSFIQFKHLNLSTPENIL